MSDYDYNYTYTEFTHRAVMNRIEAVREHLRAAAQAAQQTTETAAHNTTTENMELSNEEILGCPLPSPFKLRTYTEEPWDFMFHPYRRTQSVLSTKTEDLAEEEDSNIIQCSGRSIPQDKYLAIPGRRRRKYGGSLTLNTDIQRTWTLLSSPLPPPSFQSLSPSSSSSLSSFPTFAVTDPKGTTFCPEDSTLYHNHWRSPSGGHLTVDERYSPDWPRPGRSGYWQLQRTLPQKKQPGLPTVMVTSPEGEERYPDDLKYYYDDNFDDAEDEDCYSD
ncbi:uncharacterized protein BCR38DRAFT_490579 [Pseudomassariella vexata]|uniref:Uncharacterized protein n=1 Tax=Pseudomassariella vexata TaxID=1141098 RepID=A0A1Y2DC56_9PEZI|nr:uncharacterized protein BCR38DRAFT_490579 [Pseudomassariella vexata]ORY56696.1 hypothetical protein BCR38DRAFT_490579 [Pseudomassariella vexata]